MLDERLRTELRRAAPPADVAGVFDRVETKQRRLRRTARAKKAALIVCVLALTCATFVGLLRVFRVAPPVRPVSADQGVIVFADGGVGSSRIYAVSLSGGGTHRIGSGLAPSLSPDATRIAFLKPLFQAPSRHERFAIEVMNVNGTGVERLRTLPAIAIPVLYEQQGGPTWSPDGMKLLFIMPSSRSAARSNDLDIYVMNADGSGVRRLTTRGYAWAPAWSPTGTKIAFVHNGAVWTMNPDGSGQAPLSAGLRWADDPAWSPDGETIAVANDTGLVLLGADGSNQITLVHTHSIVRAPAWSPDGRTVAYIRCTIHWNRCGIRQVDAQTGRQVGDPIPVSDGSRTRVSWGLSPDPTEGGTP